MWRLYDPGFWLLSGGLWVIFWGLWRALRQAREAFGEWQDRRIHKTARAAVVSVNNRMKWEGWGR